MLFFINPVAKKALKAATNLSTPLFTDALGLLAGLSIISANEGLEDDAKFYSMHSWTRIFLEKKLSYNYKRDDLRSAGYLANYYVDFCAERSGCKKTLKGYSELEYELSNIRKVLNCVKNQKNNDMDISVINLAKTINVFLWSRGLWSARIEVCEQAFNSALNLIENTTDDNERTLYKSEAGLQAYYIGIVLFWQGKISDAEEWAEKSQYYMTETKDDLNIALSKRLFALINSNKGFYDEALKDFESILQEIVENESINKDKVSAFADWDVSSSEFYKVGRLSIMQEIGICLNRQGSNTSGKHQMECYNKAKDMLIKSKDLAEEIDDTEGLSVSLSHLGHAYYGLGSYNKAKKCYLQAYKLASFVQRKSTMARSYEGLAKIYSLKNKKRAFIYYGRIAADLFDRLGMKNEYKDLEKIFIDKKIKIKEN